MISVSPEFLLIWWCNINHKLSNFEVWLLLYFFSEIKTRLPRVFCLKRYGQQKIQNCTIKGNFWALVSHKQDDKAKLFSIAEKICFNMRKRFQNNGADFALIMRGLSESQTYNQELNFWSFVLGFGPVSKSKKELPLGFLYQQHRFFS